jgi:ubiquinone/menaquinone biosynthesis C-methylase UbiE
VNANGHRDSTARTKGRVLHSAGAYDVLAWLFMLGREGAFRDRLLDLVRLEPGEAVLDVGCGTGTLAIAAKRRVGRAGLVTGVDASPEMISRARKKAGRAKADVTFLEGVVETLPLPDARFDAVLSTLMLHHLPRNARRDFAREVRRVLKPGGRVLVVDFGRTPRGEKSLLGHFHRHGHVDLSDIIDVLTDAGMRVTESGAVGLRSLYYALAMAPSQVAPPATATTSPAREE